MNTIARLPADRAPRMIDLTRSLPDLRARQDGDEFSAAAVRIFLLFLILMAAVITAYLSAQ